MTKQNKKASAKSKKEKPEGEQLDLIDVHPAKARLYKEYQFTGQKDYRCRLAALKKEVEQKQKVLELVKAAELQPLEGGIIKFEYDGVIISITPRDELVKVKEKIEIAGEFEED